MQLLYNLARVSTATTGTGTITLGAAVSGYLTFANAGVTDGQTVSYGISDGANSEVGYGVYSASGTTLTRVPTTSTNSNTAISLSGSAQVFITARAQDILPILFGATVTPTALPGAATSWDTTAETALWNTAHGMTTGDTWFAVTLAPAGVTALAPYYINAADTTHFSLHLTLADALAGTNKVNITGTALTTGRKLVFSNVVSYGMSSVSPVSGIAAGTSIGLVFNLSTALSSAIAAPLLQIGNVAATGLGAKSDWAVGFPSTVATKIITYANSCFGEALLGQNPDTWSAQGTTALQVSFVLWGPI